MLQGKICNNTFIVIDAFALPVEGTETRVNAQAEAYEYIVDFNDASQVPHDLQHNNGSRIFCTSHRPISGWPMPGVGACLNLGVCQALLGCQVMSSLDSCCGAQLAWQLSKA